MRASTRNNNVRSARREAHFTHMSHRTTRVAKYEDLYDGQGNRVRAIYLGHVEVSNRQLQSVICKSPDHPTKHPFSALRHNVSHWDLTLASNNTLAALKDVA